MDDNETVTFDRFTVPIKTSDTMAKNDNWQLQEVV